MKKHFAWKLASFMLLQSGIAIAQNDDEKIDEIIVVGTQITGAQISDALPVSVMSSVDIEAIAVNSGDELLEHLVEQGQNYFSEAENVSGGVNSARGDIGAFNLRNLGTGNTLVLMNGRRMVNSAAYQTEEVGGSFVPVNTVNVQSIPVTGLQRMEVLKDGASAIYGADAVAGVINYVFKNDFDGFRIGLRGDTYESLPRTDKRFTVEWGENFGDTRVGAFLNYYDRGRVSASDDPRWANADFRHRAPAPYDDPSNTQFRNDSINSNFGQYDVVPSVSGTGLSGVITDSAGEFETFPAGDARCEFVINSEVCGAVDGNGAYRYNLNERRDIYSDLQRTNLYGYFDHSFSDNLELFSELTWYHSETESTRDAGTRLSAVSKFRMAADAYYNPLGAVGTTLRLPDSIIGTDVPVEGLELELDNYRFTQYPRSINITGDTYRLVAGLRGAFGEWDWEGAITWSKSEREDETKNRLSNTLIQAALNDTTANGFNPFAPFSNSNIEQALIDVYRRNEQELKVFDYKVSNAELIELPSGPIAFVAGFEYRDESFLDDRDPRLDGKITFTDQGGTTYPFISDVVGSSPTADSNGDRQVTSLYGELHIPVFSMLDIQLAIRYEDFSDVGDTTVGKFAFGFRPFEPILFRGSWSEAFRAPNLITINESSVTRSNTLDDYSCFLVDPTEATLDCRYGMQRTAQGSSELEAEKSDNWSLGIVLEPFEGLTLTVDYWEIEKEDTIGLFGEANHIALDLLMRLQAGNGNCASFVGNPAVVRDASTIDAATQALYDAEGICAAGEIIRVNDNYANLDTRTIKGHDVALYYSMDTNAGTFDFTVATARLDKFEQKAGELASELISAQASGALPSSVPVTGFANLVGQDGNIKSKDSIRVNWLKDDLRLSASMLRYGGFDQILSSGDEFRISSMRTYNVSGSYAMAITDEMSTMFRLGVNNVFDERAPIADDSYGYFADQHSDLGRYYYFDVRFSF